MARRTLNHTIRAAGRDQGKTYHLTEMSAAQAEHWAIRAFLALARAGADVPEDIENAGFAGVAALGFKAFGGVTYEDAKPLLDEMMTCVRIMPDPSQPAVIRPLIGEDDIEEPATYLELRKEVFGLHVDFSRVALLLKSRRGATKDGTTPGTETSPPLSE